jgi:hypothetical protein
MHELPVKRRAPTEQGLVAGLLATLASKGLRRGLRGGSRVWLYVGVTATGLRLARRLLGGGEETVFAARLEPGEGLEIRSVSRAG